MPTHSSILLIDDSPGEGELFRTTLAHTHLDVALYTEQDAEAAMHFLTDRSHPSSIQACSSHLQKGDLNWSPTARTVSPAQPSARQDSPFPRRTPSEAARSASTGDQSGLPSLILLDWHLHKTHGNEFLKRLRTDHRFAAIPVVVFTTSDDSFDLASSYANGANGYVVKPGTFDELLRFVGDLCRYWLNWNRTLCRVETTC